MVRDYFISKPSVKKVLALELMPLFIEKGIFVKDQKKGLPIRNFLRELDKEKKLSLLKHVKVVRKNANSGWYFTNNTKALKDF